MFGGSDFAGAWLCVGLCANGETSLVFACWVLTGEAKVRCKFDLVLYFHGQLNAGYNVQVLTKL